MSTNLLTRFHSHGREIHQTTVGSAFIRDLVECALGRWGEDVNVRMARREEVFGPACVATYRVVKGSPSPLC